VNSKKNYHFYLFPPSDSVNPPFSPSFYLLFPLFKVRYFAVMRGSNYSAPFFVANRGFSNHAQRYNIFS